MGNPRCVGCGEPLDTTAPRCLGCGTPAKGAGFEEDVAVTIRDGVAVPPACCCCLGKQEVTQVLKVPMTFEVSMQSLGIRQTHLRVPIPWCLGCRWRNRLLFGFTLLAFGVGSIMSLYFAFTWSGEQMSALYLLAGLVAGGLVAGLARTLLKLIIPRRAGHVNQCLAVGLSSAAASPDGQEVRVQINLKNRAFARRWIAAQSGT